MKLIVNGVEHDINAPPETPLLWVVRDLLKLKGSKFGCGAGLCGACSMLIDGASVRSCVLPVSAAAGKAITTIEGIGSPENPSPLQQAWADNSVAQCGYCQSGQIVSATALLQSNPNPTDAEIEAAMQGNLCRCGTYSKIKTTIRQVAQNAGVQVYEPRSTAVSTGEAY